MQTPAIGDWITSYSPGVWQVYRILEGFNELRYSLDERKKRSKRVIVFSKRLVDAAWKPAFKGESCAHSLTAPVSLEVQRRVDDLLSAQPDIRSAFDAYQPEPTPLIVNLAMNVPDRARLEEFGTKVLERELVGGIPLDHALVLLTKSGLAPCIGKTPFNATLQLGCRDHEVRDAEFILRDWRVYPF